MIRVYTWVSRGGYIYWSTQALVRKPPLARDTPLDAIPGPDFVCADPAYEHTNEEAFDRDMQRNFGGG